MLSVAQTDCSVSLTWKVKNVAGHYRGDARTKHVVTGTAECLHDVGSRYHADSTSFVIAHYRKGRGRIGENFRGVGQRRRPTQQRQPSSRVLQNVFYEHHCYIVHATHERFLDRAGGALHEPAMLRMRGFQTPTGVARNSLAPSRSSVANPSVNSP